MNLFNAIEEADKLRPNKIEKAIKARWVMELESEIAELMGFSAEAIIVPEYSDGQEEEMLDMQLLMKFPYEGIYTQYLMAKIDQALTETDVYMNDMEAFNNSYSEAKRWWIRHHHNKEPHEWFKT